MQKNSTSADSEPFILFTMKIRQKVILPNSTDTNIVTHIFAEAAHADLRSLEQTRSVSWLDGMKGNLNQALVSLGLVLFMLVVLSNRCLGLFFRVGYSCIWFCQYQPSDWLGR